MSLLHSIRIALDNLVVNRLRTLLTMLGIIIGVSAVIMMVSIMQGFSKRLERQVTKLGSDLIIVTYSPDSKERKQITRKIEGLKMSDVQAIRQNCDLLRAISPEMPLGNSSRAKYNGIDTDCNPVGVAPEYSDMRNVQVGTGRFVSNQDMENWAPVCIIGDKIRKELFQDQNPLGRMMEVAGQSLRVVGVLKPKGRTFEGDADKDIFIPLTTVQKRLLGTEIVGVIFAQPVNRAQMDEAKDQIWQTLMRRYDNLPGWKVDGFDSLLNVINSSLAAFTVVLGSIAGMALLVGGIGVMNIMLVSVTERTREIGLRKAIGAKSKDILLQFLVESATLTGLGGIIGITIGTAMAYLVGYITTFVPSLNDAQAGEKGISIFVPPFIIIGSFMFSMFVGVFFGVYPAIRASKLNPIEALRHE